MIIILTTAAADLFALDLPRVIPRRATVDRPLDAAYGTLKQYFTDSSLSQFTPVSSDDKTHTLVATRSGIGPNDWAELAFCTTSPTQMVYNFSDGTAGVTAKLEAAGNKTFVSVSADFQGTYTLGSNSIQIACVSKGVLEDKLIGVAGGSSPTAKP